MEMDKRCNDLVLANRKQEIHSFYARNGFDGVKFSVEETPVAGVFESPRLKNRIQYLKEEEEAPSKTFDETESKISSLEEAVKENKRNQEKEMKEFDENHAKNIEKLEEEIDTEIEEAEHSFEKDFAELDKELERVILFLTRPKTCPGHCLSYIGRVCWGLQANMYCIVLPDQFVEDLPYKVKDIEEDIDAEDLLNDEEREEASKRWEDLKEELSWDPSLERTLEMLGEKGNPMDQAGLTVEEAERAADELHKQGRLRGLTSYEKVKKIIEMWKKTFMQL